MCPWGYLPSLANSGRKCQRWLDSASRKFSHRNYRLIHEENMHISKMGILLQRSFCINFEITFEFSNTTQIPQTYGCVLTKDMILLILLWVTNFLNLLNHEHFIRSILITHNGALIKISQWLPHINSLRCLMHFDPMNLFKMSSAYNYFLLHFSPLTNRRD